MDRTERELRQAMVDAYASLPRRGLGPIAATSLAVRHGTGALITPADTIETGFAPHDIVQLDREGCFAAGHRPSGEWRLHLGLLQARADVDAVLKCQSPHATALACMERALPPFHPRVALAGGHDVPVAAYAGFATAAVAERVVEVLGERRACLLAQQGLVVVARDLREAIMLAGELEALAEIYLRASAVGEPRLLPEAEMDATRARFARLGEGLDPLD